MRLVQLKVNGFRGFATPYEFDLDADAVVVVGANGNGKTSLFDAILWCLSGRVMLELSSCCDPPRYQRCRSHAHSMDARATSHSGTGVNASKGDQPRPG